MNKEHLKFYLDRNPLKVVEGGFILPPVRLAFAHLAKPRPNRQRPGENEKYATCMIVPNEADLKAIFEAAMALGVATFGAGYPEGLKDGSYKFPFKRQAKLADKYDGFESDGFYCEAASKYPVPIVDAKGNPIAADSPLVYSGMWALVSVNLYAYGKGVAGSTKGVNLGLRSICKLADDEEFKGDGAAAVFGEVETLPSAKGANGAVAAARAPATGSAFDYV